MSYIYHKWGLSKPSLLSEIDWFQLCSFFPMVCLSIFTSWICLVSKMPDLGAKLNVHLGMAHYGTTLSQWKCDLILDFVRKRELRQKTAAKETDEDKLVPMLFIKSQVKLHLNLWPKSSAEANRADATGVTSGAAAPKWRRSKAKALEIYS